MKLRQCWFWRLSLTQKRMISDLQIKNFRCFESLRVELSPGVQFLRWEERAGEDLDSRGGLRSCAATIAAWGASGTDASGSEKERLPYRATEKTTTWSSIAAHCVERLRSITSNNRRSTNTFASLESFLSLIPTSISFAGEPEMRRRYLDFLAAQIDPAYRPTLRAYERALRSRNALLKSLHPRPRELAAYDAPLLEYGGRLSVMRARLVDRLAPMATEAHREISTDWGTIGDKFLAGNSDDFARDLAESRERESRFRQTWSDRIAMTSKSWSKQRRQTTMHRKASSEQLRSQ